MNTNAGVAVTFIVMLFKPTVRTQPPLSEIDCKAIVYVPGALLAAITAIDTGPFVETICVSVVVVPPGAVTSNFTVKFGVPAVAVKLTAALLYWQIAAGPVMFPFAVGFTLVITAEEIAGQLPPVVTLLK